MTNISKIAKASLIALLCISAATSILLFSNFYYKKYQRREIFAKEVGGLNKKTAQQLDREFKKASDLAKKLVQQIESGQIKYADLQKKLYQVLENNKDLYGAGVSFLPYQYSKKQRLFSIYFTRDKEKILSTPVAQDYTKKSTSSAYTDWYLIPMHFGPMWSEPYISYSRMYLMVEYSMPFYHINSITGKQEKAGLLYIDVSLKKINQILNANKFCPSNYCYIISKKGIFVNNPFKSFAGLSTIFDYAKRDNNPNMAKHARMALAGKSFNTEVKAPRSGQHYELFYNHLKQSGWALAVNIPKIKAFPPSKGNKQMLVLIILLVVTSIFLAFVLKIKAYNGSYRGLWVASIAFSISCLIIIISILIIKPRIIQHTYNPIFSKADINKYVSIYEKQLKGINQSSYSIPMGVLLTNINFINANDVILGGFLWQIYTKGKTDMLTPGFILPQSTKKLQTQEIFRVTQGNYTAIGWRFSTQLRLPQNATLFPFDSRKLSINFLHKDFAKNVFLLPDLDSYFLINPKFLPGVSQDIYFNQFTENASYFSYLKAQTRTSFNLVGKMHKNVPVLNFNLVLTRNFITPFINYYIIAIVIAIMIFTMIMIPKNTKSEEDRPITSVTRRLAFLASIIFIASLTHIRLRADIPVVGVSYMETYYVIIYIISLIAAIETILYVKCPNIKIIQHKDNLLFKILYWPMVMGAILISTVLYFGI